MANGWKPERRARHRKLIRTSKPSQQSTGPKSADGKPKAARNGDKGRQSNAEWAELRPLERHVSDLLRQQPDLLQRVNR